MVRPLEGIVVLDLTRLLPGPFATQLLVDLGAEVIKVEEPGLGDYMRVVPPFVEGVSYPFLMVNRGKQSIVLNLKHRDGRRIFYALVKRSDVVVEQFRPGVTRRLEIDYRRLKRINPRVIYCSFTGFGQNGPYKNLAAHDLNFEALSGILSMNCNSEGRPVIPGVPFCDIASGIMAAFSILAALISRQRTGRGEFIDVSIFDTSVALMALNIAEFLGTGKLLESGKTILTGMWPFYNVYKTLDEKFVSIAAVEEKFWRLFCRIANCKEFIDDQFATGERKEEMIRALEGIFKRRTREEWDELFSDQDLPYASVRSTEELIRDPHLRARKLLFTAQLPRGKRVKVLAHPVKFSESEIETPNRAPSMGENTGAILMRCGYKRAEIKSLKKRGIVEW